MSIIINFVLKNWKSIGVIILIGLVAFLYHRNSVLKENNNRLIKNQTILFDTLSFYKIRDSVNVSSIGVLELTLNEYKKYRQEDLSLIKDLKIKLKEVQSVVKTEVVTKIEYKDKLIYVSDTISSINYNDGWNKVDVKITNNEDYSLDIETRDSLTQVFHKVWKHKIWFIKWGDSGIKQEIINSNPKSKIIYSEAIKISKK